MARLPDSTSTTASLNLVFSSSGLSLCSGASTASACRWVTVPTRSTAAGAPGARGQPARAAAARACRARRGSAAAPRKRPPAPPELLPDPVEERNPTLPYRPVETGTIIWPLWSCRRLHCTAQLCHYAVISGNNALLTAQGIHFTASRGAEFALSPSRDGSPLLCAGREWL